MNGWGITLVAFIMALLLSLALQSYLAAMMFLVGCIATVATIIWERRNDDDDARRTSSTMVGRRGRRPAERS